MALYTVYWQDTFVGAPVNEESVFIWNMYRRKINGCWAINALFDGIYTDCVDQDTGVLLVLNFTALAFISCAQLASVYNNIYKKNCTN